MNVTEKNDTAETSVSRQLLCFFLLILVLGVYGCGGGSGSGGTFSPVTAGVITGKVIAPEELAQRLNLLPARASGRVPRALVWLEEHPENVQLTDTDGGFSFSGLQSGKAYHVVCRFDLAASGEVFLARSPELTLDSADMTAETGEIMLEKGLYSVSGFIQNQFAKAITNARLSLWGMSFRTDSTGYFITPLLPESAQTETLAINAEGYRPMSLQLPFIHSQNALPAINITLSDLNEPNYAPAVFFCQAPASVAPREKIALKISVYDPDELAAEVFSPLWQPSAAIEKTADRYQVFWTAPDVSGLATISVSVVDSRGASGSASIGIAVGGNRNPIITVESVAPASGEPGTRVIIKGSGFGAHKEKVSISFNGVIAPVYSCLDNIIETEVPVGAQSGILFLSVPNGEKSCGTFAVVDPGLAISPDHGPAGTVVQLAGRAFGVRQASDSIQINGVNAEIVSWSDTLIRFKIPENSGTGLVLLELRGQKKTAGLFKMTRVFSVSSQKATIGTEMVITGEGWGNSQGNSTLKLASNLSAIIKSWSDTRIVFQVPNGAVSGSLVASVQGISINVSELFINAVFSISADRVIAGEEIDIAGSGFGDTIADSYVAIGNTRPTIVSWSDNLIKIRVNEENRPGNLLVHVREIDSNAVPVTVSGITSLASERRPCGATLTINGFGFGNNTGFVLFDNAVATNFNVWQDNRIETVIPETATGAVLVAVNIMGKRTAGMPFAVSHIAGVDQTLGWTGREIVISGNHLGNGTNGDQITFNGILAPIISWTNERINFRVPQQAACGPVLLSISGWDSVLVEDFTVYTTFDYTQSGADWSGKRTSSRPLIPGLAHTADAVIFATDYDNGWIWRIAADGAQSKFANLDKPWGIAINPSDGRIYAAESGQHRIHVFDSAGNALGSFGSHGSANGEFSSPRGVAIDSGNRLYIAIPATAEFRYLTFPQHRPFLPASAPTVPVTGKCSIHPELSLTVSSPHILLMQAITEFSVFLQTIRPPLHHGLFPDGSVQKLLTFRPLGG
jgi:hypothetical protein